MKDSYIWVYYLQWNRIINSFWVVLIFVIPLLSTLPGLSVLPV